VSNTIRSWLDVHYLAAEDADVLDRIEEFASTTLLDNGSELLSKQLVLLVRRRVCASDSIKWAQLTNSAPR
jgi:son of sevenless-like protein